MRKFLVLLKKEVLEYLTPQAVVPLLVTIGLFFMLGKMIGQEREQTERHPEPVAVLDQDGTRTSRTLIQRTFGPAIRGHVYTRLAVDSALDQARAKKERVLVVIPTGFESGLSRGVRQKLPVYSLVNSLSLASMGLNGRVAGTLGALNDAMSHQLIRRHAPSMDDRFLKNPITSTESVVVGDRVGRIALGQVMGVLMTQIAFIPIILFLMITFASGMIAVAMATEQENKTLETLLSAPVNRNSIVAAKLIGAGVVAIAFTAVYMFGLGSYMGGISGPGPSVDAPTRAALEHLGLVLGPAGYALLGATLGLGILCALAAAMILGAFAQDIRSVQSATAPIMVLALVPYMLVMVMDLSRASTAIRWIVYADPLSYPFLAAQNVLLRRYTPVIGGIVYEAIVFLICIMIASKLFSSDRILTLKLGSKRKRAAEQVTG